MLRLADPTEYPAIDPKYFIADPGGTDLVTMIVGVRINRDILAQSPLVIDGDRRHACLQGAQHAERHELVGGRRLRIQMQERISGEGKARVEFQDDVMLADLRKKRRNLRKTAKELCLSKTQVPASGRRNPKRF